MQRKEGRLLTGPLLYKSMICPSCVALLKHLIEETEAKVVLSSTWRRFHSIEENEHYIGVPLMDKTIYLSGKRREEEINEWLSRHPDVEKYVILDDDYDVGEKNHVATSMHAGGLTLKHILEAMEILK